MDFLKMMTKAKEMQAKMAELQGELGTIETEGTSGAGLVTLTLNGKGEMKSLKIDPSLAKADEIGILEDLILAAHADARLKTEAKLAERTQEMMAGMGLPAGMKLPF
ncbi:YbaB/EbfC family nucleoid-associated protein [Segnochrobactraceae bacterium EtOH-i3]